MGNITRITAKTPDEKGKNSVSQAQKPTFPRPTSSPIDRILFFQRTIGNQAVQKLLQTDDIQAKLKIGQRNDIYEQEADRIAEYIMSMPEPQVQCQHEREKEEEVLQTKSRSVQQTEITPDLESRIQIMKSGGQPLTNSERIFFERRFDRDFRRVRVHIDSRADNLNRQLNALAFTTGQDIFFRQGVYSRASPSGLKLLAHELTHVVQQIPNLCPNSSRGHQEDNIKQDADSGAQGTRLQGQRLRLSTLAHDRRQKQPGQGEFQSKSLLTQVSNKCEITDIVQKSSLTEEQTGEWNQRVVRVIQRAIGALNRQAGPDFDSARSLTRQALRSARRLSRTFGMTTLWGIPQFLESALRDIQVQGRYVQVDLRTARYEVQRMISVRRIPSEQEAIWDRSVVQVIQEAIDVLDRLPEPDISSARSLIREADRNTRELFRTYNLDNCDLPHIRNYLESAHSALEIGRPGSRPHISLGMALFDAQRLPSYDGVRP